MYEASEIPAGAFGGSPDKPEGEVKTISFAHHIVARKGLSESTIAAFTRQLFAIRQAVMAEFPLAAKIETPDTDKDAAIPVHPVLRPLSTVRKRPFSIATAISSGGG